MKIAMVPRRFVQSDWGGTETVVLQTARCLKSQGHETVIVCPNALATSNAETIGGVDVIRTGYFYPYIGLRWEARHILDRKGGNMFSFSLLHRLAGIPDLDLIHLHTLKRVGGIGRHVARRRGIPYVVSLHGGVHDVPQSEAESFTEPTRGALEWGKLLGWAVGSRRVLDDAGAIVCVGLEEQRRTQAAYPGKRVIFLPNGVDLNRFAQGDGPRFRAKYGIPEGAPMLLTMGRIDPQKNQRMLLDVIVLLAPKHPDLRLVLVGHVTNETYHKALMREISERGLSDRVALIPGVAADSADLVDAYHAANLFVLPSVHEPFGIVILEAWAAGCPVVASRVGGIPSFVEDGLDGQLVEPDSVAGFAEAVTACLSNPQRATSMAVAGTGKARARYSWDAVTGQLLDLYQEVLREHTLRQ
jgi:glycosyltransferase involved in cell wall biosynthesis